jgi:hypothetical protein
MMMRAFVSVGVLPTFPLAGCVQLPAREREESSEKGNRPSSGREKQPYQLAALPFRELDQLAPRLPKVGQHAQFSSFPAHFSRSHSSGANGLPTSHVVASRFYRAIQLANFIGCCPRLD